MTSEDSCALRRAFESSNVITYVYNCYLKIDSIQEFVFTKDKE